MGKRRSRGCQETRIEGEERLRKEMGEQRGSRAEHTREK